jgi:serine/threonine protein kinase/tetratricopeptide (TPR) repeat protein
MQEIFLTAAERRRAEDRQAYLDQACAGDDEMRRQVDLLLKAHQEAGSVPGARAEERDQTSADGTVTEAVGVLIGPYKFLEQIGEGGMGTVWMAQQTEPVKRLVALKLIKAGMASKQVIARFESERQALALMDHPNIARVLDAGTASADRPYFVMDLVKGVPITRYCDEHRLTPRERLELFIPVCQAVQHAHQKGVIHRDLKPSNVLVALYDGRPVPKVIDFGIAKAAGQQLTERTLVTGFGAIVGTLEYMGPEQAELNQLDIDTRSDIYSLGVLLYELLTGTTPLEKKRLQEVAMLEVLRLIREEEPPRPSTRLAESKDTLPSISAQRQMEPAKLTRLVRGELDWIVMKALEKDRNRRYESANEFARDVSRYLADEPVLACPPSAGYRLRKFIRRNKAALTVGGLLLCFLVVISSGIGWAVRDRAARRARITLEVNQAIEEALRLRGVARANQRDLARWVEAVSAARRAEGLLVGVEVDDDLVRQVRELRGDLEAEEQIVRDDLRMVAALADVRLQLAAFNNKKEPFGYDYEQADVSYAQAFREYGIDVLSLTPEKAAELLQAREIRDELVATLDHWTLICLNCRPEKVDRRKHLFAVIEHADPDPWRGRVRAAMEMARLNGWQNNKALVDLVKSDKIAELPLSTLILLGLYLDRPGSPQGWAEDVLRKAQARYPGDFWVNFTLAGVLLRSPGQVDESIRFYTAALAVRPDNAHLHAMIAGLLWVKKGSLDKAIPYYEGAVRLRPDIWYYHHDLGSALTYRDQFVKALAAIDEAIRLRPDLPGPYYSRGLALDRLPEPDWDGAAKAYLDALDRCENQAERNPTLISERLPFVLSDVGQKPSWEGVIRVLDRDLMRLGRFQDLVSVRRRDLAFYEKLARLYPMMIDLRQGIAERNQSLGEALQKAGQTAEAESAYRLGLFQYKQLVEADPQINPSYRRAAVHGQCRLASFLASSGKQAEAEKMYREALQLILKLTAARPNELQDRRRLGFELYKVASLSQALGSTEEAVAAYRQALGLYQDELRSSSVNGESVLREICRTQIALGDLLWDAGRRQEAKPAYRAALESLQKLEAMPQQEDSRGQNSCQLAVFLTTCADPEQRDPQRAIKLCKKAIEEYHVFREKHPESPLHKQPTRYWQALGYSHYRAGDWNAALTTLEISNQGDFRQDGSSQFFLAMAHWQLGHKQKAHECYDQAVALMEKEDPLDADLRRRRAEAAQLLGLKDQPRSEEKPALPDKR